MTKQTKLTPAKPDHGKEVKGPTKPARMAKATNTQPKTDRGVDLAASGAPTISRGATQPEKATPPPKPPRQTKAALLRARLAEPGGVSLAALMEATGWQAHTLRAALSGLRKAGVAVTRRRKGDDTIYAIAAVDPVTAGSVTRELAGEAAADSGEPSASPPDGRATSCEGAASAALATIGATA